MHMFDIVSLYMHTLCKTMYLLSNERVFLESKDQNRVNSIFFTSTRQFFGISSFIPTFKVILKLYVVYLKLFKRKMKLVLPFFSFFNELEVHVGDMDRVMETRQWPMDELWFM